MSEEKSYRLRDGFRSRGVAADVVQAELERIQAEHGSLTSAGVFEEARPADATLHPEFTWDGEAAIRELGLIRARQIIRAVVVIQRQEDAPPIERRIWVHVPSGNPKAPAGEYEKIEVIVRKQDQFDLAVRALQHKLDSAVVALGELRRVAANPEAPEPERLVLISAVSEGFGTVRQALAALRQTS